MTIHYFLNLSFLTYMESNYHIKAEYTLNTKNKRQKHKINRYIYFKQISNAINATLKHFRTNY
ncbi:hypothetical protein AT705_17520 [Pseudoalteromonas rubra]|uniref:Uncharacterized protein n=1 Tax=Pseudoalteromonas rubra TaxID=43658 RepID=A0A0U3I961_9GAMM|nr:hypothetical protein AT705_17520 [Pseudoalteromonas rubra]